MPAVSRTGRSLAAGGARAGINGGVVAAVQGRLQVVHVHRLEDGLALLDGLPVEEQPGGVGSEASPSQHRKARGVCMYSRREGIVVERCLDVRLPPKGNAGRSETERRARDDAHSLAPKPVRLMVTVEAAARAAAAAGCVWRAQVPWRRTHRSVDVHHLHRARPSQASYYSPRAQQERRDIFVHQTTLFFQRDFFSLSKMCLLDPCVRPVRMLACEYLYSLTVRTVNFPLIIVSYYEHRYSHVSVLDTVQCGESQVFSPSPAC